MGRLRNDGSVQSANTPDARFLSRNKVDRDYAIYRCMVSQVNYIDDPSNTTFQNKQVTYNAVIIGGKKEGQEIQNIKSAFSYGGEHNFHEKIWRSIEPNTKGIGEKPIAEQTGDIVFVAFVQGDTSAPVIVGGGTQPLDEDSTGATRADGHRMRSQYNGIFEEINKSGEWEFVRKGGAYDDAKDFFTPQDKQESPEEDKLFEARLKFSKNQMLWEDPQNSMTFLKKEKKFTLQVGENTIVEELDGTNEKATRTFKSGMKVEMDGKNDKITATMSSGTTVELDGKSNKITLDAQGTTIVIDGNSGKIELSGDFVDVGKAVSDFAVLFSELATAFNSHTHQFPYFAGPAPAQGVTLPPLAPLLQTVASTTVKLQP
jgi:hypothetical protein